MRVLLDTHVFLWFVQGDERLPLKWRSLIMDSGHDFLISHVTPWEVSIKHGLGKLELGSELHSVFPGQLTENGFEFLPVRLPHILHLAKLPMHHRDPFDRMLVAQCEIERIPIISMDPQLKPYGVVMEEP